jgi:UDP-2,3-diacylglucosamine pyrophosphatase LpxH
MLKTQSRIQIKTNKPIYLVPFGDLHFGHRDANIKEFERMLRENNNADAYFIGVGDVFDSIIQQDVRFQISQMAGMQNGPLVDDIMDMYVKELSKVWKRNKIDSSHVLLMGMGNHESVMQRRYGTNPLKRFCEEHDILYGGYSGYHTLTIGDKHRNYSIHIRYHHGYGGGARTGGYPITKYEKEMMWSDADIFIFGHDHRRHLQPYPYEKMSVGGEHYYKTRRILAICGGFLENRPTTEYPSYAEEKMYPTTDMGYIKIPIQIRAIRSNGKPRRVVEFPVFE